VSNRPIIRVEHVVKSFGKVTAVNDVTFDVRAGEIFAFLGPNGAGKTTTIKMLTTLLHPTSGSLQLDGLDPVKDQTEVRRRIGVVFQDPSLDAELTALENMDIHGVLYHVPRAVRRERIEALSSDPAALLRLMDAERIERIGVIHYVSPDVIGPGVAEFTHFIFPLLKPAIRPELAASISQRVSNGTFVADMPNYWVQTTARYYFAGMYTAVLPMIPGILAIRRLWKSAHPAMYSATGSFHHGSTTDRRPARATQSA